MGPPPAPNVVTPQQGCQAGAVTAWAFGWRRLTNLMLLAGATPEPPELPLFPRGNVRYIFGNRTAKGYNYEPANAMQTRSYTKRRAARHLPRLRKRVDPHGWLPVMPRLRLGPLRVSPT